MINVKKIISVIFISLFFFTEGNALIEDGLFATVGSKVITKSDLINEIKIILILNGRSYSEDQKEKLQQAAIKSSIKRKIKLTEIEKYGNLEFDPAELTNELNNYAFDLNVNMETFENLFTANGINFKDVVDQVKIELLWNSLIFELYKNRLSINQDEIVDQLKLIQNKEEISEYLISEIIIKPVTKENLDAEIKKIKNKIKIEGFKNVAMSLSISETAIRGGDLGWVSENIIATEFKSKIINTSVGSISEPILLPEGILLIKVRDKRKSDKLINLEDEKNRLVNAEKNKLLNMYSLSHYDNLNRSISINYYVDD